MQSSYIVPLCKFLKYSPYLHQMECFNKKVLKQNFRVFCEKVIYFTGITSYYEINEHYDEFYEGKFILANLKNTTKVKHTDMVVLDEEQYKTYILLENETIF
jgi:hypothetical protein